MTNSGKSMWGGRFGEDPDEFMVRFGASLDVDITLLDADVDGSRAWVLALEKAGILSAHESALIRDGLDTVREQMKDELERGMFVFDRSLEDVHMTVEKRLTDLIGDTGAKLHTGRSRNDQVALDERLYLMRAIDDLAVMIENVEQTIIARAEEHIDTIAPSYTHLQQALPVRLGHYLMSWFWMLERDRERFVDIRNRTDSMPLGSGAVAGSGFPVDRTYLAKTLGFSGVTANSMDAVSDRDYIIETLAASSILMMHLSRIAEDLIVWSSAEFGFVKLPDRYSTGSSMMPQKKNPDSLELVRGKTGRVYGALVTILTVMKGLPFSYCKDMQEDKEPLFDTLATVDGSLRIMRGVIEGSVFDSERLEAALDDTVFATDVADYLTLKGMPFRKAHEIAGKLVRWASEHGTAMADIPLDVFKNHSGLFADDIRDVFDLRRSADRRSVAGGTGKDALTEQINMARDILRNRGVR